MKLCIIYETKRGSTGQIVEWMQETLEKYEAIDCEIKSLDDDIVFDSDLHIIGCPIYFERPMKSMQRYVKTHLEQLQQRSIAVFILGWAKGVYSRMEGHIEKNYFGPLTRGFVDNLISKHMFKGWIRKLDPEQQQEAAEWIEEIITLFRESSTI